MENLPSSESLSQKVEHLLEEKKAQAISFSEANEIYKEIDALRSQEGDHDEEIESLKGKLEVSTVTVETLPEFRILLERAALTDKSITEDAINNTLAHENAHGNVAEIVGATHNGYSMLVAKDGDKFKYNVSAVFSHPTEWLTSEKLSDVIRIFNAPNEYGNANSEDDNNRIEQLKKGSSGII